MRFARLFRRPAPPAPVPEPQVFEPELPDGTTHVAVNRVGAFVAVHPCAVDVPAREVREGVWAPAETLEGYAWRCTGCDAIGGRSQWVIFGSPERSERDTIEGANAHATGCRVTKPDAMRFGLARRVRIARPGA